MILSRIFLRFGPQCSQHYARDARDIHNQSSQKTQAPTKRGPAVDIEPTYNASRFKTANARLKLQTVPTEPSGYRRWQSKAEIVTTTVIVEYRIDPATWREFVSIQIFDADLFVRTPRHAALAARRGFKRHIDIKIVRNLARSIDFEPCTLFGLIQDNAFLQLLSLGPRKPAASPHSLARTDAFILCFLNGFRTRHRYIPAAMSERSRHEQHDKPEFPLNLVARTRLMPLGLRSTRCLSARIDRRA
jgi:hypothetical protein